jgi:hypothetical protein
VVASAVVLLNSPQLQLSGYRRFFLTGVGDFFRSPAADCRDALPSWWQSLALIADGETPQRAGERGLLR